MLSPDEKTGDAIGYTIGCHPSTMPSHTRLSTKATWHSSPLSSWLSCSTIAQEPCHTDGCRPRRSLQAVMNQGGYTFDQRESHQYICDNPTLSPARSRTSIAMSTAAGSLQVFLCNQEKGIYDDIWIT